VTRNQLDERRWADRGWPGPAGGASRSVLTGVLVAGLIGAVTLLPGRPGLGWLLTGAAVASCAVISGRRSSPARLPIPLDSLCWGAASLALLSVGSFRAAGWLYAYCVLAALLTGSLAVAGGRSVRGLTLGALAGIPGFFRALPWASEGIGALRGTRRSGSARLGVTLLISIGLLIIFGALLTSADAAFAHLLGRLAPNLDVPEVFRVIGCFLLAAMIALGAGYLAARRPTLDPPGQLTDRGTGRNRIEWVVPLAALNLLFLAFAAVQITALFGRYDDGVDYAHYARSGFFQLVVVTLLTLVVLAVVARVASRREPSDRLLLRLLSGGLAVLTLVIVASAMTRLYRYEEAFGFTRLRILVGACELWLGLVYLLILAAGVRLRAGWLPRTMAGTAVAALLAIAVLNPDRFIADQNVNRYQRTGHIDVGYLGTLSSDAVPALDRLPAQFRDCALASIATDLTDQPEDWRSWNLDRWQARQILAGRPIDSGRCY
jgi:hypothetical protein